MPIEKILVVDDDVVIRRSLEAQLRSRRCEVMTAPTLAAAKEALARDTFDLVFLDVRLPDGEGTDWLKELQQRPQRPLVVIMTGFGSVESAVDCMRNGAFDYLIKPFSADRIEVVLKKAEDFTHKRAVILAGDSPVVHPAHLCLTGMPVAPSCATEPDVHAAPLAVSPGSQEPFPTLAELEKRHIFAALERCRNNRTQAAKILEISVRTLRNKLNEYRAAAKADPGADPNSSSARNPDGNTPTATSEKLQPVS